MYTWVLFRKSHEGEGVYIQGYLVGYLKTLEERRSQGPSDVLDTTARECQEWTDR